MGCHGRNPQGLLSATDETLKCVALSASEGAALNSPVFVFRFYTIPGRCRWCANQSKPAISLGVFSRHSCGFPAPVCCHARPCIPCSPGLTTCLVLQAQHGIHRKLGIHGLFNACSCAMNARSEGFLDAKKVIIELFETSVVSGWALERASLKMQIVRHSIEER